MPRGVGAQRESHLLKRAPEVLAAYGNPAIPVHQIYSWFGISWDELAWLLKIHGVELRAEHHNRHPVPMLLPWAAFPLAVHLVLALEHRTHP